jgi:GT2 family glycosyltransferase
METIDPASISADLLDRDDGTEPVQVVPPVVAVVVTNDPGPWLEETLSALAAQDYPALSVLVVDNGSTDDPTARIAAAMPGAFVRRRAESARGGLGFSAAANDALRAVEGATFLLFCHDDVIPDPDAVRLLVEEAYRSNAGIVGPKLVDREHPEILLEVGMAVDHYGVPFSGIEPEEVDQEQHDGVRDVFFVSHAMMLVRTDLFHELAGFDPSTFPGADDVDLCWRARLAGARVIVAPAARVRHRRATVAEARKPRERGTREVRDETRSRVRVLCKSYSALALIWVLPTAFVLLLAETIGTLFSGHLRRAGALLSGWFSAFRHPMELRRARSRTQKMRQVDDGDVRDLMIRGSARVRAFFMQRMHTSERLETVSTRTRERVGEASQSVRRAPAVLGVLLAVLVLFGSRSLLLRYVPEVSGFRAWPGVGSSWSTFTASWRTTFMGAGHAATPVFALMAAIQTVLLGHGGLARSLVVGGALPLGTWGAYRLVRPMAASALPAVAAAIAYAVNPVARNAIFLGGIGPLVTFALAPFVLSAVVRACDDSRPRPTRVHAILSAGLLIAIAGSVWPPAFALGLLIVASFAIATPFARGAIVSSRATFVGVGATVLALVLCLPWVLSLFGADSATLGFQPHAPLSLSSVLGFHTARAGAGLAPFGLLAAAAVPLAIATGPRLAWATRAWVLALASYALTWLPGRISAGGAVPAPEGLLIGAALGLSFAAGLGVAAVLDDLRRFHFGWRQVMTLVAAVGLAWATVGFAADTTSGRFGLGSTDWASATAWMNDNAPPGNFRVLWVGDPNILPADAKRSGDTGFAVTRDGPGDARALWAAPESSADRVLASAIGEATTGATSRLGHLLAPAGIRYVVFITRAAPDGGATGAPQPGLSDVLARQLDLTLARIDPAGVVYQNDAWFAMHALVPPGNATVPTTATDPLAAASQTDAAAVQGVPTSGGKTAPTGPGTLLWSEAANNHWHASVSGPDPQRSDAFNWTNAFALTGNAPVHVHYDGGIAPLLRDLEILLWIAAIIAWFATRRARVAARNVRDTVIEVDA